MSNLRESLTAGRRKKGMATGIISIAMLLLFAFYANLRWANEAPAFEKAKDTADTSSYLRVSGEAFFTKAFWANTRPPIFPLLLKMYAGDVIRVAAFHAAFSIFAWGMLALSLAFSLKEILRPLAFGLILALSLERHIAGWDLALLTESLSISMMALFLAAWLWLLRGWAWGKVVLLGLVAFLWVFTRDTNGWILLMVAGLILLAVLLFKANKVYLVLALLFSFIFALSDLSAETGVRWVYPFQNVLAQRILTGQGSLSFFEQCGMPLTPELLELAGGFANSADRAFYNEPALQPYRIWLHANGRDCYMRWLLSRPLASLREPWRDFTGLLAFEDVATFFPQRYEPVLPWYVERVLFPQDALLWLWSGTTVAALVAVWKKAWRANPAWVVFIGLCLLTYPHVFIVWHGDVPGTQRHVLSASLQFVLSLWIFGFLFLEIILTKFKARGYL